MALSEMPQDFFWKNQTDCQRTRTFIVNIKDPYLKLTTVAFSDFSL